VSDSNPTLVKSCSRCSSAGPFHVDRSRKDGLHSWCMPCVNGRKRTYRKTHAPQVKAYDLSYKRENPEKVQLQDRRRRLRQLGLTVEDYEGLLVEQGGCCCAICKQPERNGKRLSVDHNHTTNKVRGLLCGNCNVSLGLMGEEPGRLRLAASYLEARG